MATVKLKFRASSTTAKEGALFYRVIHKRVVRQIKSSYRLSVNEWDYENSCIIIAETADDGRRKYLSQVENAVGKDIERIRNLISLLDESGLPYTSDMIITFFRESSGNPGLMPFANKLISQMRKSGKFRTAESYASAINSFRRFIKKPDIPLEEISSALIIEYEAYMKSTGICPNTTSYYMRNLRAIYNRAVETEIIRQRNPFKHVYTGVDKTVKRALPLSTIRRIRSLKLDDCKSLDYARDIFMFSFYTRGMSFVDMAFLRKKDLRNGFLSYRRKKTDQQLLIKWEKPMNDIIRKYDTSHTPYLLPIIHDTEKDERKQYLNAAHLVNSKLKQIGKLLGIATPLTTYVARHAWASIAKSKKVSLSVISEAMGHDSESTTRIYLASFDTSATDKANRMIMKSL